MAIQSRNPATGRRDRTFPPLEPPAIHERLSRAEQAFSRWRATSFEDRARLFRELAARLESDRDTLARLMTGEMGKLVGAARDEAVKCARACRYYADHAAALLADEVVPTEAVASYVRYEPMGAVLAIMPWNFPFWQVFRFAAPALMAGNVALLKHAPNVPQCALAIEALFLDAGFPAGVFQTLLLENEQVASLLDDVRVRAVTLTGSDRAGRDVASRAGRALKKSVLELGGSDPFLVLGSANLPKAIHAAVQARVINNGESCIAAKRFIVVDAVADEFVREFVAGMAKLRVGDPMDPATDVGPLARPDLVETLASQVDRTVAAGARVLAGGHRIEGPGDYYAPTVLVDVPKGSPAASEELFGPVAAIFRAASLDEAIVIANDTPYGLGASVWTVDPHERDRCVRELDTGQVFVNAVVASDPRVPFGGVKQSGYGRELGRLGIHEFVQPKTVWVGSW